jgi:hypothetical protein
MTMNDLLSVRSVQWITLRGCGDVRVETTGLAVYTQPRGAQPRSRGLQANLDTLLKRIKKRWRAYEKAISSSYLQELSEA